MKIYKHSIIFIALTLLSASCNPFAAKGVAGILKTENGGGDWVFSNAIAGNAKASLSGSDIAAILFEPDNLSHLLTGSYNTGLLRSEDAGVSWKVILSNFGVYDVAQSHNDAKTIYVSGTVGGHGKVLKTTDEGKSWQEVYNEESQNNTVRSMAMDPSNKDHLVIGLASGNLVESTDGGTSWKLVTNFDDQINRVRWQGSNLLVLLKTQGLMKSTDAGQHFSNLTQPLRPSSNFGNLLPGDTGAFNQFAFDNSGSVIYVTAEKGLFATTDSGTTWKNMNLPVRDKQVIVRSAAIAPSSNQIVYASAGATIYKTTNGGNSWQTQSIKTTGFVNALLIHPTLPQVAYAGAYIGQ